MDKKASLSGVLLGTLVAALAGCADTGGDIGGLLPAPKFLKGSIDNNLYTSKGSTFTVAIPHPQGSYEYKYMHVKEEEYPQGETYTSFGPAAFNQSIYRLDVTMRITPGVIVPPVADISGKMLQIDEQKAEDAYGSKPSVVASDTTPVNGHPTYHWLLEQEVAAGKLMSGAPVLLNHDIYVMDFGFAVAMVWVQTEVGTSKPSEAQGITAAEFASSVTFPPPVNDATRRVAADGTYTFPKHPATSVISPATLCGVQGTTVFESDTSVDFVAPDWLWQLGGDYAVQGFGIKKEWIGDKQKFVAGAQQFFSLYIPGDRKTLGLDLRVVSTKEMQWNGLPAMQAVGVDEGKGTLVATAILGNSSLMVVSLLYPAHSDRPDAGFPWDCYNKFLNSLKGVD